jgi:hypothetical protein
VRLRRMSDIDLGQAPHGPRRGQYADERPKLAVGGVAERQRGEGCRLNHQAKHWNVRGPLLSGGIASIKKAAQSGQVGRSFWTIARYAMAAKPLSVWSPTTPGANRTYRTQQGHHR